MVGIDLLLIGGCVFVLGLLTWSDLVSLGTTYRMLAALTALQCTVALLAGDPKDAAVPGAAAVFLAVLACRHDDDDDGDDPGADADWAHAEESWRRRVTPHRPGKGKKSR